MRRRQLAALACSGDGPRVGADRGRPLRNRCRAAAAPGRRDARPGGGPARLLLLLVRRPWWLLGIGAELGGFATHAVALRTGPLTIVQMLVASSLLFSVATVRLWSGRRLSWTAWAAVLAVIAGIASFVALASPAGGDAGAPGVSGHTGLAAACLAICAIPLAAAGLAAAGSRRAVLLAAAAGLADAGIAVVTMAFSHVVSGGLTSMAGLLGDLCPDAGRSVLAAADADRVPGGATDDHPARHRRGHPGGQPGCGQPAARRVGPARRPERRSRGPGGAGHIGRTRGARPADDWAARPGRWPRIFPPAACRLWGPFTLSDEGWSRPQRASIRHLDVQLRDTRKKLAMAVTASRTTLTEVFAPAPASPGPLSVTPGTLPGFPGRGHFAA